MPKIQLRVYHDQAEVFVNLKRKDGEGFEKFAFIVDTGAQTTLLPTRFMDILDYRLSELGDVVIEQAGFAQQSFKATEAFITIFLEDELGNQIVQFETKVWFAGEKTFLAGFGGLLERSILYVDMPKLKGNIELP